MNRTATTPVSGPRGPLLPKAPKQPGPSPDSLLSDADAATVSDLVARRRAVTTVAEADAAYRAQVVDRYSVARDLGDDDSMIDALAEASRYDGGFAVELATDPARTRPRPTRPRPPHPGNLSEVFADLLAARRASRPNADLAALAVEVEELLTAVRPNLDSRVLFTEVEAELTEFAWGTAA